ncbi:hypothetical protein [Trichothermofontia sp.]
MTDWQFLIQKAGDRAWLPLDASSTEILEGRYRIVARSSCSNTPADIQITHYALAEVPPKRRIQRRSSRINADGLMMILPFTWLKPGLWEVRCMADVMADFFGESWSHAVRLQVLANSETQDDWDLGADGAGESQPPAVEIPATAVAPSEPALPPASPHPLPCPIPVGEPEPSSPADLPLVAARSTEPEGVSIGSEGLPLTSAIAPGTSPSLDADPLLASALAQDLDQVMQTLLTTLATSPLPATVTSGGAADLGPLSIADQGSQPTAEVTGSQERLQAIAQQISEQVVERALQEFDLDAVFSGLQELLETLPVSADAGEPVPDNSANASLAIEAAPRPETGVPVEDGAAVLTAIPHPEANLPDADLLLLGPLQLSLEQEAYVVRRGQPLRLKGVVRPSSEVTEMTTTAIGELQLYLRDPQSLKVVASTGQLLPIATLPVDFCCEVNIPTDCTTQLLLGEVNLVQLTQPDAPILTGELPWAERQRLQQEADATGRVLAYSSAQTAHLLASYAFTIAADVADWLPKGGLVPDPQVIAPTPRQPERMRLELPATTAVTELPLQPSPAAKAPTTEEFLLKRPPAAKAPESVDLPLFPGHFQPQRPKPTRRPVTGISVSFIEISRRSPAAPVPTRPATLHPLPEQIYHPDPDTLRQLSPKLPAIPSLSEQFVAQNTEQPADNGVVNAKNAKVELVLTHASVALPPLAKQPDTAGGSAALGQAGLEQAGKMAATGASDNPEAANPDSANPEAASEQGKDQPSLHSRSVPFGKSLNLGQRFWSRLNAIAADAELANWLREQMEADADAESPATAALMTAVPLGSATDGEALEGWPEDNWPEDTEEAPFTTATLEPEAWEGEDWISDDWERSDESVTALGDTAEVEDEEDDFEDGEADPEVTDADAQAALDREAGDAGPSQRHRRIQELRTLVPDPTLTAEMEAFLDSLEQGPDWSADPSGLDAITTPSSTAPPVTGAASAELAHASTPEVPPEGEIPSETVMAIPDQAVHSASEVSPTFAVNPEAEATPTAREIEALLIPSDETSIGSQPVPSPVLPRVPAPHAEILVEDEPSPPAALSPGRILSHPSLFYRLADDEPVPVPVLSLPNQELVAGQSITLCVRLAKTPAQIQVKVWVQDRQTRQVLDGPRWLVDFFPCGDAMVEAWTQLTVPLGCLEIQVEAIAIEIYSQRESHKTSIGRSVIPPDLALAALGQQDYSRP